MQDGAYQAFMVAGGEDMLMTEELSLQTKNVEGRPTANPTVRPEKIFKSDLSHGNTVRGDSPNAYWTVDRIKTLTTLQSSEKGTRVIYDGVETTVGALSESLATIAKMPKSDAAGICALIIERIILKAYQTEGAWPETYKGSIMNRSFPEIAKAHIAARKGV